MVASFKFMLILAQENTMHTSSSINIRRFFLLLPFIFNLFLCNAQGFEDRHKTVFEKLEQIDAYNEYQIITLENEEFLDQMGDGGAALSGYYHHGDLVKMQLKQYKSNGISTFLYYFSEGVLFYINEQFQQFAYDQMANEYDHSKIDGFFDGKYLFQHTKLVDLETLGHNRFEDDALDPETILLEEARKYKKLLDELVE
jgi:hypothetical protein